MTQHDPAPPPIRQRREFLKSVAVAAFVVGGQQSASALGRGLMILRTQGGELPPGVCSTSETWSESYTHLYSGTTSYKEWSSLTHRPGTFTRSYAEGGTHAASFTLSWTVTWAAQTLTVVATQSHILSIYPSYTALFTDSYGEPNGQSSTVTKSYVKPHTELVSITQSRSATYHCEESKLPTESSSFPEWGPLGPSTLDLDWDAYDVESRFRAGARLNI